MADQEVVIRGEDGTEHVFPPGFNPLKAAAIVKQQSAQLPSLASMSQPRPAGGYTTSEQPEGWFSKTIRGMLHPTPEQQLAIDVLPFATGAIGSSPNADMAPRAAGAVDAVRQSVVGPTKFLIEKKLGFDPDALNLQATRMRLQAARSRTRQADMRADLAESTSPAGTAPAATSPATPPSTAPATAVSPPPAAASPNPAVLKTAAGLKQAGYSDADALQAALQAEQWLKQGASPQEVAARLEATRQLQQSGPFSHLPDDFARAQQVTTRNAKGRWPQ